MSYYANPFFPVNRRSSPYPYGYASNLYPTPAYPFATGYDDIDAEERAALAHLRSIQERKEAAQQVARREAAIRARVAAEREAAIAAAVEREREREEAIRHAIAVEQRRAAAREQYARELALAREQYAQEMERRRRAFIAQKEAARKAIQQEREENLKRKEACARRCANKCAGRQTSENEANVEWKDFNDVLSAMFGLNFTPQPAQEEVKEKEVEKPVEGKKEEVKQTPVERVEKKPVATPSVPSPKPATPATDNEKKQDHKAEINLNDLISSFLGFDVTPATSADKSTEGAEQITDRLNDFLSQFGLEFEPIKNGEASNTQTPAASAPVPTQPEIASTEQAVEGKGKGVAEGEKPIKPVDAPAPTPVEDTPAPTDASVALSKLRDISHELHLATESFTFPEHLAFASTPSSDEAVPALLFNKQNSKYHAQAHKLLQLLLAVDGISSGGDREVRKQRKALVKAIEGAIEALEVKRDEAWQEVKERRERGEESDDEGSVGSWATESTEDHFATPVPAQAVEETPATTEESTKEAEGFEVPPSPEDVENVAEESRVEKEEASEEEVNNQEEKVEEKDDGKSVEEKQSKSTAEKEDFELL